MNERERQQLANARQWSLAGCLLGAASLLIQIVRWSA